MQLQLKHSVLFLALVVAVGLGVASRPVHEPPFDGMPLSFYVEQQAAGELRKERAAREAIQAIGSNAVPHLIRTLSATESRLTPKLVGLARRQSFVRVDYTPLWEWQRLAAKACEVLGHQARAAVPSLAKLLTVPELTPTVAAALAEMAPDSVPCLTTALHNTNSTVRFYAAHALGVTQGWAGVAKPTEPE